MRKIWILTLGMFALGVDTYIVAGLLPDIGQDFHKSSSEVGQGVTVFTLCFAISAPLFSTLLAKMPVKKSLIVALILFSGANILTALSPNYIIYIISRCIAGLGAGLFSPMAISSASYLVPSHHKGKALAFTVGGMSVGTVIGVPVGLQLARIFNWRTTIVVIILIGLVALVSILFSLSNFKMSAPPSLSARFKLFLNMHVLRVVSVTICAAIASLGLYTYLADVIITFLSPLNISLFLTSWGIGGLIGSFGIGIILDKFKNTNLVMLGIMGILTLSIILIPILIHAPLLNLLPFIIWGAMGWATQAPQQHILLDKHPEHGATSVALNSSLNYLGSAIGSALGGLVLAQKQSVNILIYAACFIALLGTIIQMVNIKLSN